MQTILAEILHILSNMLYWVPALVVALSFHEYAHGWVAYRLGDPTAKQQGRLTLNPIKHVDPVGLLMLIVVRFGWAKPVPVNPIYFKGDRRRGMIAVAAAGPITNFITAFIGGLGYYISIILAMNGLGFGGHLAIFFEYLIMYNVFFGVFNLLPIPPLDGSKILFNLLPPRYSAIQFKLERYGFLILILLLVFQLHQYVLIPPATALITVINNVSRFILFLFV